MNGLKLCWPDVGKVLFKGKGIIQAWAEEMALQGWIIEKDPSKWKECDLVFYGSDSQLEHCREALGKKPTILYFWGWMPAKLLDRNFQQIAMKKLELMAQCTRILVPSLVTMDQVADFGLPSYVCLPGVDTRLLDQGEPVNVEPSRVLFLSRIVPHKQPEALIHALSLIKPSPKLLMIGPGDVDPLKELADKLGVPIEFIEVDDTMKGTELRKGTVLVHPSCYEGFGLPPLEALYCGTPVLAFDIPQMRWLLQEDAYYFSTVEGLAQTLVHMFQNYDEAREKAAHGSKRIKDSLTLKHACDRLWGPIHQTHKEFWAGVVKRDLSRRVEAYDQEHKRNWAYSVDRFDPTWERHWRAQTFIDLLKGCKAEHILDVGCGTVYPTIFGRAGFEVTALDISTECLRQVDEVAEKWGVREKVHPQQGDAEALDFDDDVFDGVIHGELWEHIPNPEKAVSEGLRVLKPGGYLIATSPIGTHHYDAYHLRTWDDNSIRELLKNWESNVVKLEKIAEEGTEPSCYLIVLKK